MKLFKYFKVICLTISFSMLFVNSYADISLTREKLNTKSARLDTLQLSVSIEDEANVIGLHQWGENPAGILLDEYKNRLVPAIQFYNDKLKRPTRTIDKDIFSYGIFGVFKNDIQAIQIETTGQAYKQESNTNITDKDQNFGGVLYNHRFGQILVGLGVDYITETERATTTKSDPLSSVIGFGWDKQLNKGSLALGISYDFGNIKTGSLYVESEDIIGIQSVYNLDNILSFGISFKNSELENNPKATGYNKSEHEENEIKLRGFYNPKNVPFQFGLEMLSSDDDFKQYSTKAAQTITTTRNTKTTNATIGIAFVPNKKGLVGVEAEFENRDFGANQKDDTALYAIGAEYELIKNLLGRASFSYTDLKVNTSGSSELLRDKRNYGLGVGYYIGENYKVDFSYERTHQNSNTDKNGEEDTDIVNLVGTIYFN